MLTATCVCQLEVCILSTPKQQASRGELELGTATTLKRSINAMLTLLCRCSMRAQRQALTASWWQPVAVCWALQLSAATSQRRSSGHTRCQV
jgi:hypothetical protein